MEMIKIENGVLDTIVSKKLADFERKIKALKKEEDELKVALLTAMEKNNVVKLDTDDLTINYVSETNRETFNSRKFRKDHADMYDEYVDIRPVKASVRIKVK